MKAAFWAMCLSVASAATQAGELDQLAWLAGHWVSPDGAAEEVWLEPKGGSMTGSFRWVFPNGKQVLEYMVIEETEDGVIFRFKHFGTDFVPWETNEPNTYRLVSLENHQVLFERVSESQKAPKRYQYSRDGDMLHFRGEGDEGEDPLLLSFKRRE